MLILLQHSAKSLIIGKHSKSFPVRGDMKHHKVEPNSLYYDISEIPEVSHLEDLRVGF